MDETQDRERTFMVFTSVGYFYYSGETNKNTAKRAEKGRPWAERGWHAVSPSQTCPQISFS